MTHEELTPAPVDVTQADRDRAEAFWQEYGPFRMGTVSALSAAFARHRLAHSAPAGEVTQVDRATRTARFLADQKAAAAALASLPDSTRARLEAWQTAQSEWFDGTVLEIVAEFIAFENTRHSAPADLVERIEQLDLLQETNLPNGEWDTETFRATLALCKRHLSTAKHGGA